MHLRAILPCAAALCLVAACADGGAPVAPALDGPRLSVSVAPLTLDGVGDACYTLAVANASGPVFSRADLCSSAFGDGAGALTYVAPCDASAPAHTVSLTLQSLWADQVGGTALSDWMNPCPLGAPCERPATCVDNGDTPVGFDLTVMRRAQQGFFDVAVELDDLFCSAKVDCLDEQGAPLALLHDPTGARGRTAVVALSCVGDGTDADGADTHLYMNDLRIDCGAASAVVDPSAGPGNLREGEGIAQDDGVLFGAATYRGPANGAADGLYWNVALGLDALVPAPLVAGAVERVSVSTVGGQVSAHLVHLHNTLGLSADGQLSVFLTDAGFDPPAGSGAQVYLRDRVASTTTLVSRAASGVAPDAAASSATLTADGSAVFFSSAATNLLPVATTGMQRIYRYDVASGALDAVSLNAAGDPADNHSQAPSASHDGRYVAFISTASNLVAGTGPTWQRVYLKDRQTGLVELVSMPTSGVIPAGHSNDPKLSADGRYVAFTSAIALDAGDTNGSQDVYVRDRASDTLTLVSAVPTGFLAYEPAISANGRYVTFHTSGQLLAEDVDSRTDVYRRDLLDASLTLISAGSVDAGGAAVADDGTVVFSTTSQPGVTPEANTASEVFRYDGASGAITRLALSTTGGEPSGGSAQNGKKITPDGRHVLFTSAASDYVVGDTNTVVDAFVLDFTGGGAVCTLTTRATAADGALAGDATPAGATYPVIDFEVDLTAADGSLLCGRHRLDDGAGVTTGYTPQASEGFDHVYAAAPTVLSHTDDLVFYLDAGDAESWPGSGQVWRNLVASPADGSPRAAYDFQLGVSDVPDARDPAFVGTPGGRSVNDYFDVGGRLFRIGANTPLIHSIHKDGAKLTIVMWIHYAGTQRYGSFIGTYGWSSSNPGFTYSVRNDARHMFATGQFNTNFAVAWGPIPSVGRHMLAVSIDEAAGPGGSFLYKDGAIDPAEVSDATGRFDAAYNNPTTADTTCPLEIGNTGCAINDNFLPNGSRVYAVRVFNRALTEEELGAEWALARERLGL